MNTLITPIILAGGSGTRLWPASRKLLPKQFLNLTDTSLSLFQQTVLRANALENVESPIVVCNEEHRFLVAEQLLEIGVKAQHILLEPCAKNTAPAITLAALLHMNPDANLLVLPADHLLEDISVFQNAITQALACSNNDYLFTFGIQPTRPETGYGYIETGKPLDEGCFEVACFVEKPDKQRAQDYIASGRFLWNSGQFLFPKSLLLNELAKYQPEIVEFCKKALAHISTDIDFSRVPLDIFSSCPAVSIDYALMEHTQHAAVVKLNTAWSDIGAWDALWENRHKDEHNNAIMGDVLAYDTSNSLVYAQHRLVATLGIRDALIVETKDALLVADKNKAQEVKHIVATLENQQRKELHEHARTYRPWGWYESICTGSRFQVKRILVKSGASLSLQKHQHRAEHWVIVKGKAKVTNGKEVCFFEEDQSTYIPLGNVHRLENMEKTDLEIIEIQTGNYLGEDDIERLEDNYGRTLS